MGRANLEEIEDPPGVAFAHLVAGMTTSVLDCDAAAALSDAAVLGELAQASLVFGAWTQLLAGQPGAAGWKLGPQQGLAKAAEATSAWQAPGICVGRGGKLLMEAQVFVRAGLAGMAVEAMDRPLAWIGSVRAGMTVS